MAGRKCTCWFKFRLIFLDLCEERVGWKEGRSSIFNNHVEATCELLYCFVSSLQKESFPFVSTKRQMPSDWKKILISVSRSSLGIKRSHRRKRIRNLCILTWVLVRELKYRNFNYYKNRIRPRSVRQSARGLEQGLSGEKIIGMQRSRRIALRQLEISISDLLLVAGACPAPTWAARCYPGERGRFQDKEGRFHGGKNLVHSDVTVHSSSRIR